MIDTSTSTKVRTAILSGKQLLNNEDRNQYFYPLNSQSGAGGGVQGRNHLVGRDFPSCFYYRKPQTSRSKQRRKSLEQ